MPEITWETREREINRLIGKFKWDLRTEAESVSEKIAWHPLRDIYVVRSVLIRFFESMTIDCVAGLEFEDLVTVAINVVGAIERWGKEQEALQLRDEWCLDQARELVELRQRVRQLEGTATRRRQRRQGETPEIE
jgi:hypothetical protein